MVKHHHQSDTYLSKAVDANIALLVAFPPMYFSLYAQIFMFSMDGYYSKTDCPLRRVVGDK